MAGSKRQSVTDAELAVLKVLWEHGPLSAKTIAEVVYPNGAESEFAAVHSFLQRLERKGLVARDRSSFVHLFSAKASQADILGQELKTLVERLGTGSVAPLHHAADRSETIEPKGSGRNSQIVGKIPPIMRAVP